ncbi:hypothetical protein PIB30_064301 [Stylosanthes scabra]|uniref:Uncharacterized protein n=1 Tax=Stylosanthes scabra TaxID=79078 RepID=A0ABU6XK98_9FABA|nr:hypothetical protein [Stylosanthes scabra]
MAMVRPRGKLGHSRPKLPKVYGASTSSSWRARIARAPARWPWCVRTQELGALGTTTGRVARPRPSDGMPAMDSKRKSLVAKGKGKLAMPPTRKSPRLAGLSPSLPPTSPKSVLTL